jgi:hypothetical protein
LFSARCWREVGRAVAVGVVWGVGDGLAMMMMIHTPREVRWIGAQREKPMRSIDLFITYCGGVPRWRR